MAAGHRGLADLRPGRLEGGGGLLQAVEDVGVDALAGQLGDHADPQALDAPARARR